MRSGRAWRTALGAATVLCLACGGCGQEVSRGGTVTFDEEVSVAFWTNDGKYLAGDQSLADAVMADYAWDTPTGVTVIECDVTASPGSVSYFGDGGIVTAPGVTVHLKGTAAIDKTCPLKQQVIAVRLPAVGEIARSTRTMPWVTDPCSAAPAWAALRVDLTLPTGAEADPLAEISGDPQRRAVAEKLAERAALRVEIVKFDVRAADAD